MRLDLKRNPYTTLFAVALSASLMLSLFTGSVVYVAVATVFCVVAYIYSVLLLHRLEEFHQVVLSLDVSDEERKELKFLFTVRAWMPLFIKLSKIRRRTEGDQAEIEHAIQLARIELRRPDIWKSFVEKMRRQTK